MAPCPHSAQGSCRYGSKCNAPYNNQMSPKATHEQSAGQLLSKPKARSAQKEVVPKVIEKPTSTPSTIAVVIDGNFPNISAVTNRHSDPLIFPLEARAPPTALRIVRGMEFSDKAYDSAAEVETLNWVLAQSNASNSGWMPSKVSARLATALTFPYVANNVRSTAYISFSRVYMALIGYFTSEGVLKTALLSHVNALFTILDGNIAQVLSTLKKNLKACAVTNSFVDDSRRVYGQRYPHGLVKVVSGVQIFNPIISMLNEYVIRFRHAPTHHPELVDFVSDLKRLFDAWADRVLSATNKDPLAKRPLDQTSAIIGCVRKNLHELTLRVENTLPKFEAVTYSGRSGPSVGLLATIEREYDGPGELSTEGPRHSNDHVHIRDIKVPPTGDEMISVRRPYLPINIAGAKHHLPHDSMAKLLDIHFRLLRADSINGLQQGIQSVIGDLQSKDFCGTELARCLREGGGWYTSHTGGCDSVRLSILTNAKYTNLSLDSRRGLVIHVTADVPPGRARTGSIKARKEFWEDGTRLPQGGLVAVVAKTKSSAGTQEIEVSIATLTMSPKDFRHSNNPDSGYNRFSFGLHFFDDSVGMKAIRIFQQDDDREVGTRFVLGSPVLYESVRPFLQTLQQLDDRLVPIQQYLVHRDLIGKRVNLPQYMQDHPGRVWDLSCLLKDESEVRLCQFSPHDEVSIAKARVTMHEHGKLDPSQSNAVIASLCREIALIQGPPGTGKTFTGVELLRVLFANKAGPVLLLAFTNHALDHILRAIHDGGVTKHIVRMGSRCRDEIVSELNLDNISRVKGNTKLNGIVGRSFSETKEFVNVLDSFISSRSSGSLLASYLHMHYPSLMESLDRAPEWVGIWLNLHSVGDWEHVDNRKNKRTVLPVNCQWEFWKDGADIDKLIGLHGQDAEVEPEPEQQTLRKVVHRFTFRAKAEQSRDVDDRRALTPLGLDFLVDEVSDIGDDEFQAIAAGLRDYSDSESDSDVNARNSSSAEQMGPTAAEAAGDRRLFLEFFKLQELPCIPSTKRPIDELLKVLDSGGTAWEFSKFERRQLVRKLEREAKQQIDDDSMDSFQQLAHRHKESRAKLEEASDNVRVSLLEKIELVGATTNELSMDNRRGPDLFHLDMSLMERLDASGLAMSQLYVQRRMTPPISSLIRNTLYPNLVDHELVFQYPNVVGMAKNLFFMHHTNPEKASGPNGNSKSNPFEAQMACDLALHLLKQGCYSKEGDIVILCAYLGQILEIRERLNSKVPVNIDERDQERLVKTLGDGDDEGPAPILPPSTTAKQVETNKQIFLRTVDNFQGEEAAVVILSLVRNAGTDDNVSDTTRSTIGFLRSCNRINVALSRAKHGMYIFGNADQLASGSEMWRTIIHELEDEGAIGPGIPANIFCWQLENLSAVRCKTPMSKLLPFCEHSAMVECHREDLADVVCSARCAESMGCCNQLCGGRCHSCRSLTKAKDAKRYHQREGAAIEDPKPGVFARRISHVEHNVHLLATNLAHLAWRAVPGCVSISNAQCPVGCLAIVSHAMRLLDQVVNLIMQSNLRDTLADDPDVRLVTLECGHIFTAETLDWHMDINLYYTKINGQWNGLLTPTGYQDRKTCPSCRDSISSPRYSRVTKRALFDLQEQVAVARFNATLQVHVTTLNAITEEGLTNHVKQLLDTVAMPSATKFDGKRMATELGAFTEKMIHGVSTKAFTCDKNNMFGMSGVLSGVWRKAAQCHLDLYGGLSKLANQNRMPHNVAYDGAVSLVYFKELELARKSPLRDPKQAALLMARRCVGAPPPGGQTVYSVEALALTIEVRRKMSQLALSISDYLLSGGDLRRFKDLQSHDDERAVLNACRRGALSFQRLSIGLLLSCTRDAQVMIGLATERGLPRLVLQGHFLWLMATYELSRCKWLWTLRQLSRNNDSTMHVDLDAKAAMAQRGADERAQCTSRFLKAFGALSVEQKNNQTFLREAEKIKSEARLVAVEWVKFESKMKAGERFDKIAFEPKQSVVLRAAVARFYDTPGRLYQCPNGHPCIIANCGGYMEESRCPECGEIIGGRNHLLHEDNRVNEEREETISRVNPRWEAVDPFVGRW
ncbi:hypothetical protein CspeluHIS016_0302540 [Cutaneotrichosporon spelunceum]|uniref:P-loop containing nucleoside triphosphate hydrolase protein n=1 Tax=Cutaneotrichosporon spelunceum TaxID=1672016 RepID=A0AAD3TTA9_9TREE|nr:hypothetical protein CspeluHIS016_0302540 [Cutaneotrichosporon spelunceum]